jgi:hypothetical protein
VLTDGKIVKRGNLLKVHDTNISNVDVTKKISEQNKIKRYLQHSRLNIRNV